MATIRDFPARGTIAALRGDRVVFCPLGTSYELHLSPVGDAHAGPAGPRVEGLVRLSANKLLTVPSGGNFIEPIAGPPRIVQGRIRYLDELEMVVQAGTPIIVALPRQDSAYDLPNGPLTVGALVNVTVAPEATFELLARASAK